MFPSVNDITCNTFVVLVRGKQKLNVSLLLKALSSLQCTERFTLYSLADRFT